ncbi:hypothetical protein GGI09_003107 [Coemansia sp. S100]|nr:hypothetical protein LPJ71_003672 [Coemansia sp. S17]KAJ2098831.1 hypothetical protein GGI09_003107 [Coemansia sp. S100]KAJ2106954.1 hypothetical protein GGI16_001725 [Coemansia sp. S142-1]
MIALVLTCILAALLSLRYLSYSLPSVKEEIMIETETETKYIEALGFEYQPQPKDKQSELPKLISNGKSSWNNTELDLFSDESRKILKTGEDLAPQTLDPDSDSLLILTPLKNSAKHLAKYFKLIDKLKYPRHKISLAFLVSDSTDNTLQLVVEAKKKYQEQGPKELQFKRFEVYRQDFFYTLSRKERHLYKNQFDRRTLMARARNYLWTRALENEQWVLWIDGDLEYYPPNIVNDMMAYDKDVLVPNCLVNRRIHRFKWEYGIYDFNSWQETPESIEMLKMIKDEAFLIEGDGDSPFRTKRKYMNGFDKSETIVPLDGVGGTFTLVKSHVHRSGIGFPVWLFQHQVETEGFAKLAKANGFGVFGLPNYNIHHIYN